MFETFRNAWKIEDLRKRLLYTLVILVIFRLGCAVPVPYIDASSLTEMFNTTGSMLTYLNMMSGDALSQCAIFALGVQPYINASIIVQLLTVAIPYLENLSKEGEEGRRKLTRITNYVGAGIGLMLSIAYYFILRRMGALEYTDGFGGIFTAIVIVLCFTAGSQLVTWMGNQIDSKGIGNGVSLLIFAGIVANWSRVITMVQGILTRAQQAAGYYVLLPVLLLPPPLPLLSLRRSLTSNKPMPSSLVIGNKSGLNKKPVPTTRSCRSLTLFRCLLNNTKRCGGAKKRR